MMEFFQGWIINIVTLVLIIVLIEILAPSGKLKKLVSLVSGFILIIAILQPLLSQMGKGIDLDWLNFKETEELSRLELQKSSEEAYGRRMKQVAEVYRNKVLNQIEKAALEVKGVKTAKAEVMINEDYNSENFGFIKRVYVSYSPGKDDKGIETVTKVQEVKIGNGNEEQKTELTGKKADPSIEKGIRNKVKSLYQMKEEDIVINLID